MYAQALDNEFARDVRAGLMHSGQKTLPCRYLYDDIGSALFEAITYLPEYGLTRADARVIQAHAGDLVRRM
ncbi:MAG TPA: L-histidine N(alpha)-methyltransferase, partial [Candidatus Solibacter sp.]|nr:L-histidine N(alpha)-methyltransferase [Candidatus Solibacter sp.]